MSNYLFTGFFWQFLLPWRNDQKPICNCSILQHKQIELKDFWCEFVHLTNCFQKQNNRKIRQISWIFWNLTSSSLNSVFFLHKSVILIKFTKSDVLRQNQWNFPFWIALNDLTYIMITEHIDKQKCAQLLIYLCIFHSLKLLLPKISLNFTYLFQSINLWKIYPKIIALGCVDRAPEVARFFRNCSDLMKQNKSVVKVWKKSLTETADAISSKSDFGNEFLER